MKPAPWQGISAKKQKHDDDDDAGDDDDAAAAGWWVVVQSYWATVQHGEAWTFTWLRWHNLAINTITGVGRWFSSTGKAWQPAMFDHYATDM